VFLFSKIIEKICKSQYEIKKSNTVTKTKRIYKNKRIKKITEPIPKKRNTEKARKSPKKPKKV
jgi:putative IMPACT (imprinted ancient) family translation regulator